MTTMVTGYNEKMLPTSYSIAAWPHWLCITFHTVWCITSTWDGPFASRGRREPQNLKAGAFLSTLEHGPHFAERGPVHLLRTSAWDMGHTTLC